MENCHAPQPSLLLSWVQIRNKSFEIVLLTALKFIWWQIFLSHSLFASLSLALLACGISLNINWFKWPNVLGNNVLKELPKYLIGTWMIQCWAKTIKYCHRIELKIENKCKNSTNILRLLGHSKCVYENSLFVSEIFVVKLNLCIN